MQILVVEDSSTLRAGMKTMISRLGHTPVLAKSGEEALQMLANYSIDMVMMDIELPGLDGYETTMLLREAFAGTWIPIIFVTGNASDRSVLQAIEAGGDDYLVKPVSETLMNAKIIAMQRIANMQAELRRLNQKLSEQSETDPLTGLPNRRVFNIKAADLFETARRFNLPVSIMMMDIDHFKTYNDNYGHLQGDICLQKVSALLRTVVRRKTDLIARFGGEEFIVMMIDTDLSETRMIAEEILNTIRDAEILHEFSSVGPYVSLSIGVSVVIPDNSGYRLQDCIKKADDQLYKAKNRGRGQAVIDEGNKHLTALITSADQAFVKDVVKVLQHQTILLTSDAGEESNDIIRQVHPDLVVCDTRPGSAVIPDKVARMVQPGEFTECLVVDLSSGGRREYTDIREMLSDAHMIAP